MCIEVINGMADTIVELEAKLAEREWIPCSKTLPEKNGVYIVSYEDAVTWLEWFNGKWFFYPSNPAREETGTIIAWMPFPEPWNGVMIGERYGNREE